jgi:hypothetical protein
VRKDGGPSIPLHAKDILGSSTIDELINLINSRVGADEFQSS